MSHSKEELKHRVQAKKKELEAKLETAKADGHQNASQTKEDIEQKLNQINGYLKESWDDLTESTAQKINALIR